MKALRLSLALVASLALAAPVSAATIVWQANLTGDQENPPTGSTATGEGTVTYDEGTNVLSLFLSWSGLSGPGQQAHIHCCTSPSLNTGIALDLWLTGNPQPATGTFSLTFDLDTDNPFRPTFVTNNGGTTTSAFAALRAAMDAPGFAYYNIHTTAFPGGEIRGNLVPEPASLLLLGAGLAAGYRRFRA